MRSFSRGLPMAATAVSLLLMGSVNAATPASRCERLEMVTRDVRGDLRDQVEEYYRHLRAAEARLVERRWTNVYESPPHRRSIAFVTMSPRPCGLPAQPAQVALDMRMRTEYVLERAFGETEAARLCESLDEATIAVSTDVLSARDSDTEIPWRDLGVPALLLTRSDFRVLRFRADLSTPR